ncbi:MAG: peptidoglycan-binding protein [Sulfitobacter sp.]|nr:peptidoglycan-binding protein [Sulfitobacter sp.]
MTRIISALLGAFLFLSLCHSQTVLAQSAADNVVWVQIEAQPSLAEAMRSARNYAADIEDVNGFALGGGWYAIALGPYRRADAELVLRTYRRDRLIPRDSYLQLTSRFRSQFWPVGANVLSQTAVTPPAAPQPQEETETAEAAQTQPADETVAEARRSESALNRQERRDLQTALKWAGFYAAAIDGAFGRGTRQSMSDWQAANNFEPTGVLTTLQRAALIRQYNAVLEDLDLKSVRNDRAGIQIMLPTAEVTFSRIAPPFVHYDSSGDIGAQVLLISQPGDQNTLFGLYDIMQTLEIVPLEGPRERLKSSFTLVGANDRIVSETRATLSDGQIKGFTLIWPAGDEARRTRLVEEMAKSFTRLPDVLDPAAGGDAEQAIDLVAGLQLRKPRLSRSGFFIDRNGAVATTSEVVQGCSRVTIDGDTEAEVLADAADKGIALLKPRAALAPLAVAAFSADTPRLQSEVSVAGYSYEGVLSAATLTFGTIADLRGLEGEDELNRLSLTAQEGDTGGPIFDGSGNVIGLLLPRDTQGKLLPVDVHFALDTAAIAEVASNAGLSLSASDRTESIAPRDLRIAAQGMTVLVSCWE